MGSLAQHGTHGTLPSLLRLGAPSPTNTGLEGGPGKNSLVENRAVQWLSWKHGAADQGSHLHPVDVLPALRFPVPACPAITSSGSQGSEASPGC